MPSKRVRRLAQVLIFSLAAILSVLSFRLAAQQSSAQLPAVPAVAQVPPPSSAQSGDPLAFREDWSSLSIDKTDLRPMTPVLGNVVDLPQNNFISERYQVQWRPEDPMDLYVIRPRNVKKPPIVLYLYSYPDDTERFTNPGWCTRVTGGGYAAIGFVSALTGHRFHDRPMKEWFVSEFQESLGKSVHDVQMIVNYLSTRDDLDMGHVGMFGTGSGGTIAILAAAADSRIKAIDVLDPWGDWPDWLAKSSLVHDDERANFLKPEFLASVAGLDPVQWLPKLKSKHIRIQDNADDPTDPQAVQKAIETAAPENAEINQFGDGAALVRAMGGGSLFDWIKDQVKPGAEMKIVAADQRVHAYPAQGGSIH
jgi:hypothetical protein